MRNKRLYGIWSGMKTRCANPKNPGYKNYGGRGIAVCEEWRECFRVFQSWALENGYDENLSIDRINNNGNYEPSNCRWATHQQQAENKRQSHNHVGKTQDKLDEILRLTDLVLEKIGSKEFADVVRKKLALKQSVKS